MPAEQEFRLDELSHVKGQILSLVTKAESLDMRKEVVAALANAITQMRTRPLEWGDPQYDTHKQGGTVFHAMQPPLDVHYVVYQGERAVLILDIKPVPNSPLA